MSQKPILFSGPMIRAILEGRKTQTRRLAKPRFNDRTPCEHWQGASGVMFRHCEHGSEGLGCPYGEPCDRLWVKETWAYNQDPELYDSIRYIADGEVLKPEISSDTCGDDYCNVGFRFSGFCDNPDECKKKRPSIFMPRWASRITLEIAAVRVERLQSISEGDALAEGVGEFGEYVPGCDVSTPRDAYKELWAQINGADSWAANPWVWVIEFKRI
jgi:hypothetical protein